MLFIIISLFLLLLVLAYVMLSRIIQANTVTYRHKKSYAKIMKNNSVPQQQRETANVEDKIWHEGETEFVFNLYEKMSTSLGQEKASQYIAESVNKFFYVDKVVLLSIDRDSGEFEIGHAVGLDKDMIAKFKLSKREGIAGFIASQKMPLMVNDLEKEGYYKRLNRESYLTKSFIGVPLIFQSEVLGVMYICDKKPDKEFTSRDFALMANIGKAGAIVFQNCKLYEQIQKEYLKTITALVLALDARDHYTKSHSENVARYSLAIAEEMQVSAPRKRDINSAALLHDIGKIGIKDSILLDRAPLNEEGFAQIKLHPLKGEDIVKPLAFLKDVAILIRQHHERCDGTGYPDGLRGEEIELGAKILAVADSFDAMNTDRPYRKALPTDEIIAEILKDKATKFDPLVVDSFLKVLKNNPGIVSKLTT